MVRAVSFICHRRKYPMFVNQGSQVCVIDGNVTATSVFQRENHR